LPTLTVTNVSLPRRCTEKGTPPAVMYPIARNGSKIPILSTSPPPAAFLGFGFAGDEGGAPAARVLEWVWEVEGKAAAGGGERGSSGGYRVGQFGRVGSGLAV